MHILSRMCFQLKQRNGRGQWGGNRGGNKSGRWPGSGRRQSGIRESCEGGRREKRGAFSFFNEFLVPFEQTYQKSEPKNIDYLLF